MEVTPQFPDRAPDQSPVPGELVLARAAALMRDGPEPGWNAVRERLMAAVRATARRSTPIRAELPVDQPAKPTWPAGTLQVSDLVVTALLRIALNQVTGCVPSRIDLLIGDENPSGRTDHPQRQGLGGRLAGVRVDLTAVFGADLTALAAQVRSVTAALLSDVIGVSALPGGGVPIDVRIADVVPAAD
jgi:hypothetical protein